MGLFLRNTLMFFYSLGLMAMMSGDPVSALPWKPSPFDSKSVVQNNKTQPALTLVFDMDETILWQRYPECSQENNCSKCKTRRPCKAPVYRSGMLELLRGLRKNQRLKLILWTAARGDWVPADLWMIFEDVYHQQRWPSGRYSSNAPKDLERLGENIHRLVMFDNCKQAIRFNPENALLVHGFHGASGYNEEPNPTEEDNTANNIRYIVERLLNISKETPVSHEIQRISFTGGLIEHLNIELPQGWTSEHVNQLAWEQKFDRIPAHGKFLRVSKSFVPEQSPINLAVSSATAASQLGGSAYE